jgi:hypothetical protein
MTQAVCASQWALETKQKLLSSLGSMTSQHVFPDRTRGIKPSSPLFSHSKAGEQNTSLLLVRPPPREMPIEEGWKRKFKIPTSPIFISPFAPIRHVSPTSLSKFELIIAKLPSPLIVRPYVTTRWREPHVITGNFINNPSDIPPIKTRH